VGSDGTIQIEDPQPGLNPPQRDLSSPIPYAITGIVPSGGGNRDFVQVALQLAGSITQRAQSSSEMQSRGAQIGATVGGGPGTGVSAQSSASEQETHGEETRIISPAPSGIISFRIQISPSDVQEPPPPWETGEYPIDVQEPPPSPAE